MAYLIFETEGKKKKLTLKKDFIFIGSGEGSHLRLKDPGVAGQHCQILRSDDGYRVLDLGSGKGTFVNGEKIEQKDLSEGDVIRIGGTEFVIKDLETATPDGYARPVTVPATGKPGTAKRRSGRRTARKGTRQKPEPLKLKAEYAAASERGGERLVRKNLRKGSKLPGWAQAVIALWVVVIVVVLLLWVVKQAKPSPYESQYSKAQDFIRQNQVYKAIKTLEKIPVDDYHWGQMANDLRTELLAQIEHGDIAQNIKRSFEYYENNIMLYLHKYIDAPEDKPKWAMRIRRDHAPDRQSYIRALILRRLDTYIREFSENRNIEDVKRLRKRYLKEVDLDQRPTFRDTEIEAEAEMNLNGFGAAYQLMDG